MSQPLLQVRELTTSFSTSKGELRAVDHISFDIQRGETFALLGESGCGKSMTALSLMRLLPPQAQQAISGSVLLEGEDLMALPEVAMRNVRGNRIAMIFQEPMTSLNPVITVGKQIAESLRRHKGMSGAAIVKRVVELMDAVGIPDPDRRINEYPHQLSGGMKQRVMIAIALAGEPDLLIADEPTTALDVTIQAQVLDLLKDLQQRTGMSILLITHDLGVVSGMANHVGVMYAGQIVELASRDRFFQNAAHPYSAKLFAALPEATKRETALEVIHGTVPSLTTVFKGCRFAPRCDRVWGYCQQNIPVWLDLDEHHGVRCHVYDKSVEQSEIRPEKQNASKSQQSNAEAANSMLLRLDDLKVHFPIHKGILRRVAGYVYAVDGVSLDVKKGQTVALVGESGCGKTTVGKAIIQLLKSTSGTIEFDGEELTKLRGEVLRKRRKDFQIIFQDPFSSMNPRMLVGDIIEEGMIAQGVGENEQARKQRVEELLVHVGLPSESKLRYPHEFSGGQRQRICIARALAVQPKLIVCDEPTSALDVSVQAQILNLLKELQDQLGLSYLFITHNISVVSYLAHQVAVMYLGRIVESGAVDQVLASPKHPYTKALLSAVPVIDDDGQRDVIRLEGDIPSPINPPSGCHFRSRCPDAHEVCQHTYPEAVEESQGHFVRCHLYNS